MSRAEKFIQDYTRNCSNELDAEYVEDAVYMPWLTPDQARRAVELAREEIIEKICSFITDNISKYIELKHANPTTFIEIDGDRFANDLKQHVKNYE